MFWRLRLWWQERRWWEAEQAYRKWWGEHIDG